MKNLFLFLLLSIVLVGCGSNEAHNLRMIEESGMPPEAVEVLKESLGRWGLPFWRHDFRIVEITQPTDLTYLHKVGDEGIQSGFRNNANFEPGARILTMAEATEGWCVRVDAGVQLMIFRSANSLYYSQVIMDLGANRQPLSIKEAWEIFNC